MENTYALIILENSVNGRTFMDLTQNVNRAVKRENGLLARHKASSYTRTHRDGGEWILKILVEDLRRFEGVKLLHYIRRARQAKLKVSNLCVRLRALREGLLRQELSCCCEWSCV